jgi:hypothetical protein
MELIIDHVMFPVYMNNDYLAVAKEVWESHEAGDVAMAEQGPSFKGLYNRSKSFYVEYLSTVRNEPYWSNAIYLVVPNEHWDYYENPAIRTDHFLIPRFGSGFQLVSPDFPHLNSKLATNVEYDGFTLLISKALETELMNIGGLTWSMPGNGKLRVHEGLHHLHDMAVINEGNKIVAPVLEANPLLREYL